MTTTKKSAAVKSVTTKVYSDSRWNICYGELKKPTKLGRPRKDVEHLFRVIGEKLPDESLPKVRAHLKNEGHTLTGVYVAHDSMGCPRYIGRGNIFQRLEARKKAQPLELEYSSFYVVTEKNTNVKLSRF